MTDDVNELEMAINIGLDCMKAARAKDAGWLLLSVFKLSKFPKYGTRYLAAMFFVGVARLMPRLKQDGFSVDDVAGGVKSNLEPWIDLPLDGIAQCINGVWDDDAPVSLPWFDSAIIMAAAGMEFINEEPGYLEFIHGGVRLDLISGQELSPDELVAEMTKHGVEPPTRK